MISERLLVCCLVASLSTAAAAEPLRAPVRLESPVQDKNFYLLSLLERTPDVRDAVRTEPALARMAADRLAALDKAAEACRAACRPIDDKRGTIAYRVKTAGVLLKRTVAIAAKRAGGN